MPSDSQPVVAIKVCGACGREVSSDSEIGKLYFCEWFLRAAPVVIKRTPAWRCS